MNKNDQEFLVQKIRTQYTEKQHTELDALKELDAKVKRPANVFAYIYGSISAIVMGAGMSLVMTDLGQILGTHAAFAPFLGILVGIVGGLLISLAYPVYQTVIKRERKKIAPEILRLSEELMK